MKLKPALIIFAPPALVVLTVVILYPEMTWVSFLAIGAAIGTFCAFAQSFFD